LITLDTGVAVPACRTCREVRELSLEIHDLALEIRELVLEGVGGFAAK
jgi:hypothetical protein